MSKTEKNDKSTKFDAFVKDVESRFTKIEDLIKARPPKVSQDKDKGVTKDKDDFTLIRESYDKKFDDMSKEVTELKEIFTGIKDRAEKAPGKALLDVLIGF